MDGANSEYRSLYYLDSEINWIKSSLQRINVDASENISSLLFDYVNKGNPLPNCYNVIHDIKQLSFTQDFFESISFMSVEGPSKGTITAKIPFLDISNDYNVGNTRMREQDVLFILNTSPDKPLQNQINKCANERIIGCLNINSNLISEIEGVYLKPNNITVESQYCKSEESEQVESAIKTSLGISEA